MPLPPAPNKRAALLPPQAYDAPARPLHKARKTEGSHEGSPIAERAVVLEFDPRGGSGGGDSHPEALLRETTDTYTEQVETAVRRAMQPAARPARKTPKSTGPKKLFVLDTNVLMHDPMSLFRF